MHGLAELPLTLLECSIRDKVSKSTKYFTFCSYIGSKAEIIEKGLGLVMPVPEAVSWDVCYRH